MDRDISSNLKWGNSILKQKASCFIKLLLDKWICSSAISGRIAGRDSVEERPATSASLTAH